MTEIKLQEKKSGPWGWIAALVVLALLIWAGMALLDNDDDIEIDDAAVMAPATPVAPAAAPVDAPIMVVTIVATPTVYKGQEVRGTATVADVISDRGFWLEQDSMRIFAIIDEPVPETININPGQTVQLTATVYTDVADLDKPIEDDARAAIKDQPAFLYVKASDIKIIEKP